MKATWVLVYLIISLLERSELVLLESDTRHLFQGLRNPVFYPVVPRLIKQERPGKILGLNKDHRWSPGVKIQDPGQSLQLWLSNKDELNLFEENFNDFTPLVFPWVICKKHYYIISSNGYRLLCTEQAWRFLCGTWHREVPSSFWLPTHFLGSAVKAWPRSRQSYRSNVSNYVVYFCPKKFEKTGWLSVSH